MSNNRYSVGLIIVAVGIVLLLGKLGVFGFFWGTFWPVFLLAPGLLFHALYFNRTLPSGVLIPGGILVTISILFFLCTLFGWGLMAYLWPGFIFAVAVGLYEFYLFDKHSPRGTLVAALVLAIVSGVLFGMTILFTVGIYFIALVLIAVGAYLIFFNKQRRPW
ncbi:LiaF transmembrane domain-containing protein [Paenibacillus flagellatus]|uniref:LiaF transmembrane domain-containing protein n=1 Tax=Paenibacillus flagellatus TaxID=2211139 RepID=A0A2V5K5P4_9BACL|nr:DUF5668 domain-containing protein [Paenibacillus flagellatus]PYI54618.1 hypothetical protein DLM86_14280 [Paenibacillus flagellatus]